MREKTLLWIIRFTKGCRLKLLALTVVSVLLSFLMIEMPNIIKDFVDIATGQSDLEIPTVAISAIIFVIMLGNLYVISSLLEHYLCGAIERKMRLYMIDNIFSKSFVDINGMHSGTLLSKLTMDVQGAANILPQVFGGIMHNVLVILLGTVSLFLLNWQMAIILLVITPLLIFSMTLLSPLLQKAITKDRVAEENNRTYMQEVFSKLLLLKSYMMGDFVHQKINNLYEIKLKTNSKVGLYKGLLSFAQHLIVLGLLLGTLGIGSYFVLHKLVTVGTLIAMVQLVNFIVGPFSNFPRWISQIQEAKASVKRLKELLQIEDEDKKLANGKKLTIEAIHLNSVSFKYPNSEKDVLSSVNFSAKQNEITCIIGESGSGKSTLLKLLLGLYAPAKGVIDYHIFSNELSDLNILKSTAYIPSDNLLFSGTLSENICMTNVFDLELLEKMSNYANIKSFVDKQPEAFDFKLKENGSNVSSGQAQRIAIARALYKETSVLIFDEPTSNLDQTSIDLFYEMIQEISKNKICIIVTHDMKVASRCSHVYELKDKQLQLLQAEIF